MDLDERRWACASLAHLVFDQNAVKQLVSGGLIPKVVGLVADQLWVVRVGAAGVLRYVESKLLIKNPHNILKTLL